MRSWKFLVSCGSNGKCGSLANRVDERSDKQVLVFFVKLNENSKTLSVFTGTSGKRQPE
jgi:hypothetical protein